MRIATELHRSIFSPAARNPQIVSRSFQVARRDWEVGFLEMEFSLKLGQTCVIKIKNECL